MRSGFFVVSDRFIGLGGVSRTDWFNHSTTFQHHVDVRQPHRRLSGGVSHDHLLTISRSLEQSCSPNLGSQRLRSQLRLVCQEPTQSSGTVLVRQDQADVPWRSTTAARHHQGLSMVLRCDEPHRHFYQINSHLHDDSHWKQWEQVQPTLWMR